MIILLSRAPTPEDIRNTALGWLLTPNMWGSVDAIIKTRQPWACDNGCYSKWSEKRFLDMLWRVKRQPRLQWVAVPDVVGDHQATRERFRGWMGLLGNNQIPMAFVLQDGCTIDEVPWECIKAVFVGGSTAWKLGPDAAAIVAEAKRLRLWAHMGRANSIRRMVYAREIGCDSVDGTSWARWRDKLASRANKGLTCPVQMSMRLAEATL